MFLRQRVLDFDFWLQVMFSWHSVWTNEMLPNFSFTNNFDLFFKLFLTFRSCDHHTILKYRTRHFLNLRKSTYFVFAYIILPYNYFIYIYKILRMKNWLKLNVWKVRNSYFELVAGSNTAAGAGCHMLCPLTIWLYLDLLSRYIPQKMERSA